MWSGQIGTGATMVITNRGLIDASGSKAVTIDISAGKLTNGTYGILEASGTGGLVIKRGSVNNTGTIMALDASAVTMQTGSTLLNDAAGVLSGGRYMSLSTGDGATVTVAGPAVTTLAARIVLSGAGSEFEAGTTTLEASLATIAAGGSLELLAGKNSTDGNALTDAGSLQLGGGDFASPDFAIAAGGSLTGFGTVSGLGSIVNDGVIQAKGGALYLGDSLTGTGVTRLYGNSTLELGGAEGAGQTVQFNPGANLVLKLDDPAAFSGTLANLASSTTIDLVDTLATSAQISGNTLKIGLSGGGELDYHLSNPAQLRIVVSGDGAGGTNIRFAQPTTAMAQLMAAMAGSSASGSIASRGPAPLVLGAMAPPH